MRPYTVTLDFHPQPFPETWNVQFVSDGLGRFIHPDFDHAWEFETRQAAMDAAQVANVFYADAVKISIWYKFGQPDGKEIVCK